MKAWRMKEPCESCPFSDSSKGRHQRRTLRPGRMAEITRGLRAGATFYCHKTTSAATDDDEDDDETFIPRGNELVCAGAIAWSEAHGVSSQYVRIAERLEASARARGESSTCYTDGMGVQGVIAARWRLEGHHVEVEDLADDKLSRRLWLFTPVIGHNLGEPWRLRLEEFWDQVRPTTRHKFVRRTDTKGYNGRNNRAYWEGAGRPLAEVPLPAEVEAAAVGVVVELARSTKVVRE